VPTYKITVEGTYCDKRSSLSHKEDFKNLKIFILFIPENKNLHKLKRPELLTIINQSREVLLKGRGKA